MQEQTIEITISADGNKVDLEAIGFNGKGCSMALNDLGTALGQIGPLRKKSEFYNTDNNQDVLVTKR